jgi:integrase
MLAGYASTRVAPAMPAFQTLAGDRLGRVAAYACIRKAARAARMDMAGVGTHSMRKTHAGVAYRYYLAKLAKGEQVDPVRMVQHVLGHSSIATTEKYLTPPGRVAWEVAPAIAEAFRGPA